MAAAAAVATRAAVALCVVAVLLSCCTTSVSGAWPWELGRQKNTTTTTEAPASKSPKVTTGASNTTTPVPPTAESTPRLRSRQKNNSKKNHSLTTATTPQPATTKNVNITTTTTEAAAPSSPPAAVQSEPQFVASVQLPPAPLPEMPPIVIVEPDTYADAGRTYRSMYEQPYSGMYPPPNPYAAPMPYYSAPPSPPLPPYPSPYNPYQFGGYPSYQWPPMEPAYMRPYRSYPFVPAQSMGNYSPYPWLQPQVQTAPAQGGCNAETKRDREELSPTLVDAARDQNVEEPSPTYLSLLPSYDAKVPTLDTSKPSSSDESNVRTETQESEQPNTATGNNAYGVGKTIGRENHILRNNPYQPAPQSSYWPGYYNQGQWPQWSQWQQWPGAQQPQYAYAAAPQQPSVVQAQKRGVQYPPSPDNGSGGLQQA